MKRLNANVKVFEDRGVARTLETLRRSVENLQRQREELMTRRQEVSGRIEELNAELSSQQVSQKPSHVANSFNMNCCISHSIYKFMQ